MLNPTIMALSHNREQSVLNAKLQDSLLGKTWYVIFRGNNIYCLPI